METQYDRPLVVIAYSGHAYVCIETAISQGYSIKGYCDVQTKTINPYSLSYLGSESDIVFPNDDQYFVGIGNNAIRRKIHRFLSDKNAVITNLIHPRSVVSNTTSLGVGILISAGSIINPQVTIDDGVICNTGCIIEHECKIGAYTHIAPGAVLAGNVIVGKETFVGANATIKQGVRIGKNVIIGAGSVVLKDVPDNTTMVGNPARTLSKKP